MIYELEFHSDALKEWKKLPKSIQEQFKKAIKHGLENPRIPKHRLHGELKDCYKIKLLKAGYRLVYKVIEASVRICVIAVGKREDSVVYKIAEQLINDDGNGVVVILGKK